MNLILTSDVSATLPAGVVAAMRQGAAQPRIAWIPSQTDPTGERFADAERRFRAVGLAGIELLDIDADCDPVQIAYLHEYDVVHLDGDDALRFRFNAARSGLAGRLRQFLASGRVIVGSGAGALLLTPNVSLWRLREEGLDEVLATRGRYDALGAVPYELLPDAERWPADVHARVREYSAHVDHDVLVLAAGGIIFHEGASGDRVEGTLSRYRKGTIIEP